MKVATKIVIFFSVIAILFCLSPFILYGGFWIVGKIEYEIDTYIENKATEKAIPMIEKFTVDNQNYDIGTIIVGISNSEIEFRNTGTEFVIDSFEYSMGHSPFNNKCTYWLHSYNDKENDVPLMNDICKVLNNYDLDYEYVDTYIYRGSGYGDSYVYGEYDTGYLNGQYLEITLRPIEGPYTVLRFDLDLVSGTVESNIIQDLRGIDNIYEAELPWSIGTLLGLVNIVQ